MNRLKGRGIKLFWRVGPRGYLSLMFWNDSVNFETQFFSGMCRNEPFWRIYPKLNSFKIHLKSTVQNSSKKHRFRNSFEKKLLWEFVLNTLCSRICPIGQMSEIFLKRIFWQFLKRTDVNSVETRRFRQFVQKQLFWSCPLQNVFQNFSRKGSLARMLLQKAVLHNLFETDPSGVFVRNSFGKLLRKGQLWRTSMKRTMLHSSETCRIWQFVRNWPLRWICLKLTVFANLSQINSFWWICLKRSVFENLSEIIGFRVFLTKWLYPNFPKWTVFENLSETNHFDEFL